MAAFRDAQDGRLWRLSMRELVVYIDNQLERSDNYSEDEIEVLQMVRDQIFEIIRDENLLLWD
jgi:hypothetical protein